jgi:hypothetical protein
LAIVLSVRLQYTDSDWLWVKVMVFNATFNNISAISWRSVLLVEETIVPGENQKKIKEVRIINKKETG